jgi:ParB family chromosome partitioning protein
VADLKKKSLGKGLGALISVDIERPPAAAASQSAIIQGLNDEDRVLHLDPREIIPNPQQPRKAFSEDALQELAESVRREGVQEPVIVRKKDGVYELISGERRVRASIMADLETIPAICRNVSDADMLRLGIIENIQREDLNPIELAQAYQALINECRYTQEQLADEVGKKRATVTNILRLLNLPDEVQAFVTDGSLTMGHARALLALPSKEAQRAAARKIIEQGLSVRETEKLAAPPEPKAKKASDPKDPNVSKLEDEMRSLLGSKVTVRNLRGNRGRIEIEYYTLDDLDRILNVMRSGK